MTSFLGQPVPIGPLDNAAIYTALTPAGLPGLSVALPIEVKNLRDWIYPSNPELYQLLSKSHRLARAQPSVAVMPVLVCRRAHATTFRMAKDLGFFVVETHRQYISTAADEDRLREVRAELGFHDLARQDGPDRVLLRRLTGPLPSNAAAAAERWAQVAAEEDFGVAFEFMRTDSRVVYRSRMFRDLRLVARANDLLSGGW